MLCENELNGAKAKIIQFRDSGDISANEVQNLIATFDVFIVELTDLYTHLDSAITAQ